MRIADSSKQVIVTYTNTSTVPVAKPAVDTLFSTKQVAERLQMSEKAVREAADSGSLPGRKFPPGSRKGKWRFRWDGVETAMKASKQRREQFDTIDTSPIQIKKMTRTRYGDGLSQRRRDIRYISGRCSMIDVIIIGAGGSGLGIHG